MTRKKEIPLGKPIYSYMALMRSESKKKNKMKIKRYNHVRYLLYEV